MWPHLDYKDVNYDQPSSEPFLGRTESIQHNIVPATTGSIRGSSRKKLYQELGLEDLHQRRWMSRCFCLLDKVLSTEKPTYIYALLPSLWKAFRDPNTFNAFSYRTEYFENFVFLECYQWME